jgi:uncharacterized protein (DUF736 family)
MPDFDNTNRGALFRNDDKMEEKHPDYRGNINVDGTEYWLSAWIKTSKKNGMKYMSLSVKLKNADTTKPKNAGGGARPQDFDDDIPFAAEFR